MKTFHVYLLASRSRTLYVGVTSDLLRRVFEHRTHAVPGFTARYRIDRLVHFEETGDAYAAIAREKQIKGWRRSKKVALIEVGNPTWEDLAADWYAWTFQPPTLSSRAQRGICWFSVGGQQQVPRCARDDSSWCGVVKPASDDGLPPHPFTMPDQDATPETP